ncbi:MAG: mannan-binding protein [Psychrosphaera sp.]|nr:mannan-binding protein [Psychrosphaera sp.]
MKTPLIKLMFTGLLSLSVIQLAGCNTSANSTSNSAADITVNYVSNGAANTYNCPINPQWLINPVFPTEVAQSDPKGGSTFCDFYQFSTQAYLYLMSPAPGNATLRNFQIDKNYPLLEFNDDAVGTPADSCDGVTNAKTLRTSLQKSSISTGQAGGGSSIYAQDGNVVYYDVRFNKSLCKLSGSAVELAKQNIINFPSGTTELKFAWKVLSEQEITGNTFVTQQQMFENTIKTFGLVGMHIAIATTDHPEFVWATFEHKTNTPNCDAQGPQDTNWLFSDHGNDSCTAKLPTSAATSDLCQFNQPTVKNGGATGTPTNICAVYPYGTDSGDLKAGENLANIISQNDSLYSALAKLTAPSSMTVLDNYFNVGDIWISDITQNTGGIGVPNERGSLRLANTVAETDFQHVNLNTGFSSNCFGCHNYVGTGQPKNNNITSQALSHSFIDVVVGQGKAADVNAIEPIGSNAQAKLICNGDSRAAADTATNKGTCKSTRSYLKWNNQWTNDNSSSGSVCGCESE